MLELLQRLIAFKYSCKLNHWKTDSYAKHLLFDRLQGDIDDFVDKVAEGYFMNVKKQDNLDQAILQIEYIDKDLAKLAVDIIKHIEIITDSMKFTQGMLSLLGNISESFDGKLALLKNLN